MRGAVRVGVEDIPLISAIVEQVRKVRFYVKVMKGEEILRRYFVMNAFDGALTMLGIVLGAVMAGATNEKIIIGAGVSASFAMGVSGFVGAFMTEKAERERLIRELERALLTDLDDTMLGRASLIVTIVAAVVDGASPALAALTASIPFFLVSAGVLSFTQAVYASLAIILSMLTLLGAVLGKISQASVVKYSLVMVASGLLVALLSLLVGGH